MAFGINVMGRSYTALAVGSGGWTAAKDLESAQALITDNAPDNPYALVVQDPLVAGSGSVPHGAMSIYKSNVVVVAEPGAYLDRPAGSTDPDYGESGGTLFVAHRDDSTLVEDVALLGLDVRRNRSGDTGGEGNPPEAAIFVGRDPGIVSFHPSTAVWNDVHIIDCDAWGVHDGIQWIGTAYDTTDEWPPFGTQRINRIYSCHDASTFKGNMRVWSVLNQIHSRGSGFPLLTDIADWKTTGHHVNVDFPRKTATSDYDAHPLALLFFDRDTIHVESDANTKAATNTQSHVAGVLVYGPLAAVAPQINACPRIIANNLTVRVDHSEAVNVDTLAGFAVTFNEDHTASETHNIAEGRIVVNGGRYRVRQLSTDAGAPDDAHGVLLRGGANSGGTKTVVVSKTLLDVQNDKGGGNAYGISSMSTGDVVKHLARGRVGTGLNAVNGSISTISEVA